MHNDGQKESVRGTMEKIHPSVSKTQEQRHCSFFRYLTRFFFPFWRNYFDDRTNIFQGLFSDLTSYMLMTTRSVEKLNEKLERPVPTLQFRPNILVSTQQPFEEDNWEWIKIGERVVIRNVKPCSRYSKSIFDITDIYIYKIINR